jgi:very-short-patch-repair endonuclease
MSGEPKKVWYPGMTNPATLVRARELRQEATDTEEYLWSLLRKRPAGFKFRRQHPIGKYVLDFYVAEARLAIELDGSVHDGDEQQEADSWRQAIIATNNIQFIRFKNDEVLTDVEAVIKRIVLRCEELTSSK